MNARSIEAEVSIKSGVQAECTIGREVIIEVHDEVNLESLKVTANGHYEPEAGVDGFSMVDVDVPAPIYDTEIWIFTMDDDSTVTKVVILDD